MISCLSSRSVTHAQSQLTISTKAKAKKTRFLSRSPPQVEGAYEGLRLWAVGEVVQPPLAASAR